eukprot:NODE_352_length_10276_cov_0.244178.p3 type:complete len:356 gc:universal NODE_352_length_10276_cov_0.244178:1133-66(-)
MNMPNYQKLLNETRLLFDFELPNREYKFSTDITPAKSLNLNLDDLKNKPDSLAVSTKPNFKLSKVLIGHDGWVRSICMDPYNKFFATGSTDKLIKIWTLQGNLKLSLTGHVASIRDLCISQQHPYLYSASEDKTIRCWDLTANKAIRKYHGHLHGVYCIALSDTGLWMASGGRDACCRIWDVRTRKQELVLTGHEKTISSVLIKDNHIITGGMDSTIRIYDKRNGEMIKGLTQHMNGVRSLVAHPTLNCFFSASSNNIKVWKFDTYSHFNDLECENGIINSLSCNESTLVAGNESGQLQFFDTEIMRKIYTIQSLPQPGSLDSESAILKCCFNGETLFTGEADKTIKIWDMLYKN